MVERGGLENRFPQMRNGGSNPSLSAFLIMQFPQSNTIRRAERIILSASTILTAETSDI